MKSKIYLTQVFAIVFFYGIFGLSAQMVNSYKLNLDLDMRKISVEANLETKGSYLLMNWEAASFLPDGWSKFVTNIQAYNPDNHPIELSYERPGKWKMGRQANRVRLTYEIAIEHDKIVWEEGGHDESAYVLDDLLFMIGRVIFITAGQHPETDRNSSYEVEFKDLPDQFKVTTTWDRRDSDGNKWIVRSTYELLSSLILIGEQHRYFVQYEDTRVVLAGAPAYKSGLETFASVFETLLPHAQTTLGPTDSSKFVLVANVAPATRDPYFSGGVLHRGISIISPFIPDESVLPMVQHLLFHEYLHLYTLAMNVKPEEEATNYWFFEGVHDYLSNFLLYDSGMIGKEAFLNGQTGLLGNQIAYEGVENKLNIREAGHAKFENYELIYNGGHVFGLFLDIAFLKSSQGEYRLVDFFRELAQKQYHNALNMENLDFEALYQHAVLRGGPEVKELMDRHIVGNDPMSLEMALKDIGLEVIASSDNSNARIVPKANAEKESQLLHQAFFEYTKLHR